MPLLPAARRADRPGLGPPAPSRAMLRVPAARGTARKAPVRATPQPLPPAVRLVGQLGLVPPVLLRAIPTPQALQQTPCGANNHQKRMKRDQVCFSCAELGSSVPSSFEAQPTP